MLLKIKLRKTYQGKTLEKLDELFGLLNKKYCDKNETKKAFIYIENKVIHYLRLFYKAN